MSGHSAFKHHPDKTNGSAESGILFRDIYEAYKVISDPELREQYDRYLKNSTVVRNRADNFSSMAAGSAKKDSAASILERICSELNFILWEIEDIFSMRGIDFNRQKYSGSSIRDWLLHILYFADRWVLTPAGYGDHFFEAGKLKGQNAFSSVGNGFNNPGHNPYMSFTDYFFQMRKRMDKMINRLNLSDLSAKVPGYSLTVSDSIYETLNLSYHYLGSLQSVISGKTDTVDKFNHSDILFDEHIAGILE